MFRCNLSHSRIRPLDQYKHPSTYTLKNRQRNEHLALKHVHSSTFTRAKAQNEEFLTECPALISKWEPSKLPDPQHRITCQQRRLKIPTRPHRHEHPQGKKNGRIPFIPSDDREREVASSPGQQIRFFAPKAKGNREQSRLGFTESRNATPGGSPAR